MQHYDELGPQLEKWLPGQRWFQGKDRSVTRVRVADVAPLTEALVLVIAEVAYDDHPVDRYLVPLCRAEGGPFEFDGRSWQDALTDPGAARVLAARACDRRRTYARSGAAVEGAPVGGEQPPAEVDVRPLGAEQSNTSVVLGRRWILKVLRRLEAGTHPDIELTAALTAHGFAHVPAQHGSLQLVDEGEPTALAVLSDFAAGAEEGWTLATAEAAEAAEGAEAAEVAEAASIGGALRERLPALGEAVADLHLTLAQALGSRPAEPGEPRRWVDAMLTQLDRVLAAAARRAPEATADVRAAAGDIRALLARAAEAEDVGPLVRIHGDLHLGQVLLAPDGRWLLLDFEGEPTRPLHQRRMPGSPLRDVAGMLRSFDYAAAEGHGGHVPPAGAAWRDDARARFLHGYRARGSTLLPPPDVAETLLKAWELDKAVYELGYELANRPAWVSIPAGGILRLIGAR